MSDTGAATALFAPESRRVAFSLRITNRHVSDVRVLYLRHQATFWSRRIERNCWGVTESES